MDVGGATPRIDCEIVGDGDGAAPVAAAGRYIYAHAPHATPHTRLASVSVTRVVLNCEELRGTSMTEGIALGVTAVVSSAPRDD